MKPATRLGLLVAGVLSFCLAAAQTDLNLRPDEYFSKACSGAQIGVALTTGATYECVRGTWARLDVPKCVPDPPEGACSGNPVCQSASASTLFLCSSGSWSGMATSESGGGCSACVIAPLAATPDTLARFDGTTGRLLADSSATLTDSGTLTLATPLGIASGGTGGATAAAARTFLNVPSTAQVVHPYGDETITGQKTFTGSLLGARFNGIRYSNLFPSIASALGDLPATGGTLQVDPGGTDLTAFADLNPAGPSSGRRDTLALDLRNGGARFLSSMREYPSGAAGALEDRVPFVFQVRLDDATRVDDAAAGAIGEWNCGRPGTGSESCPSGASSWQIAGGSRQYWYSGQCNTKSDSWVGDSAMCGGPHIFQIRYPEVPGSHPAKPIFAVGSGGASLFAPENPSTQWRSYLTMFRGADGGGDVTKANTPMFTFDHGGASFDGGFYVGAVQTWPEFSSNRYDQFNAWVAHDVAFDKPAFVVEGPSGSSVAAQTAPLVKYYDRSNGRGTFVHPGIAREAFGFYNHSRLYLGSFRDDVLATDRGQFIEWEGTTVDANRTRLRVDNPTAPRDAYLPDRSGTIVVATDTSESGPMFWGAAGKTGDQVCDASGLTCETTTGLGGGGGSKPCSQSHTGYFAALCFARR